MKAVPDPQPGRGDALSLVALQRRIEAALNAHPIAQPSLRTVALNNSLQDWMLSGDVTIVVTASAGGSTLNLLAATKAGRRIINIVNLGASPVTLSPNGSDTAELASVAAGASRQLHCDGVGHWYTIC